MGAILWLSPTSQDFDSACAVSPIRSVRNKERKLHIRYDCELSSRLYLWQSKQFQARPRKTLSEKQATKETVGVLVSHSKGFS